MFASFALAQARKEPALKSRGLLMYPPIARAANVSGMVTVEFTLNNQGETVGVVATNGPPMLRGGAELFVKACKFDVMGVTLDPERKYEATIRYTVIQGGEDEIDGAPPTIHIDPLLHADITIRTGGVDASGCPLGEATNVPGAIAEDDFVELSRSSCYGTCPAYSVRVQADGKVLWDGGEYVEVRGKRQAQIGEGAARDLLKKFLTSEFWSYCSGYSRNATDLSSSEVSVKLAGKTREINDYGDSSPLPMRALMYEIDRATDSHRWRHGDPAGEPITRLRSEGYLPKPGLTPFIKAAIWNKSGQLKEMIDAGADLGQVDASGWNALMYAAYNSDSSAMKVLLKAGADPNQTSPHGDTPLIASAVGRSWGDDLVRAGARVNAQNKDGQTALMLLAAIDEVDAIRDALKAGSNPKLKDSKGRTALDYLRLATCRKSPIADPVENWDAEGAKCDAFDPEDVRAVAKLLRNPLQLKEQ
jgi:hypothetical protein